MCVVCFQRTMALASLCGRAQSGGTVALRFGDRRQAFCTHQRHPRPEPSTAVSFLTARKGSIVCLQCDLEFCKQDSQKQRRWVF